MQEKVEQMLMQNINKSSQSTPLNNQDAVIRELKEAVSAIEELTKQVSEVYKAVSAPKEKLPDTQKVAGNVSILNALSAKISNFPSIFKVQGKVDVDFPKIQQVKGKVEVDFPKVQEIKGNIGVDLTDLKKANVELAKLLEKIVAKEIKFPLAEGETPSSKANPTKYLPVRLTNGKTFYEVMSQTVSSSGRVVSTLERLISSIERQVKYDFMLDDTSEADVMYLGEASAGSALNASVWRIKKMNTATGIQARFAGGSDLFDKRWDLRTTYTY